MISSISLTNIGILIHTSLIILRLPKNTLASVQFCLDGRHYFYSQGLKEGFPNVEDSDQQDGQIIRCREGIRFNVPTRIYAVISEEEPFCYKESIRDKCWKCNTQKHNIVAELVKFGKPTNNESWSYTNDDDGITLDSSESLYKCQSPKHLGSRHNNHVNQIRNKREITGLVPSEPTNSDQIQRETDDQTKRMFYYLSGLDRDSVNSHLRVVKLFQMFTLLVPMICDPQFVSEKFLQQIERGFLFILKEQGLEKIVDLDLESYSQLYQAMEHCASTVQMVNFKGDPCPTGIKIKSVYVLDEQDQMKSIEYKKSSKTFKWGEYDVVIDGAWHTLSVVYAGCFGSFRGNVNLLHKMGMAVEQLFHSALHFRWEHPTQLADDLFYDNIFMGRVNDTFEALDACTKILYLLTPFHVQLNRPIFETVYRRRKRSTNSVVSSGKPLTKSQHISYLSRKISRDAADYSRYHPKYKCLEVIEEIRTKNRIC